MLGLSPATSSYTGPVQNVRPMTDAAWRADFSASGSRSMRAASTAWIESGTRESLPAAPRTPRLPLLRVSTPRSMRVPTSSSTKNGLPSARSTTRSRIGSGTSAPSNSATRRSVSVGGQRLEAHGRGALPRAAPCRAAVEHLGASSDQDDQGALYLGNQGVEQVAQIVLGPVHVLDQ